MDVLVFTDQQERERERESERDSGKYALAT